MAANKIIYFGEPLLDIMDTTAVETDVASGKIFYRADGNLSKGNGGGVYNISMNVTNGSYVGATNLVLYSTGYITVTPNEGYKLPDSISITSSSGDSPDYGYDRRTGEIWVRFDEGVGQNDFTINVECQEFDPGTPYVRFRLTQTGLLTLQTANGSKNWDGTLEYNTDPDDPSSTWTIWNGEQISGGDGSICIRGTNNTYLSAKDDAKRWLAASDQEGALVDIEGNIENLLDYQSVAQDIHPPVAMACFRRLFESYSGDNNIYRKTPKIGCTIVGQNAFREMFKNATNINTISALHVESVTMGYAFYDMYNGCSSIAVYDYSDSGYNALTMPSVGLNSFDNMFANTGGNVTTPTAGTTYYTPNEVID